MAKFTSPATWTRSTESSSATEVIAAQPSRHGSQASHLADLRARMTAAGVDASTLAAAAQPDKATWPKRGARRSTRRSKTAP